MDQTEVDWSLWLMTLPAVDLVDHTIGQHSEFYWCLIETFYSPMAHNWSLSHNH